MLCFVKDLLLTNRFLFFFHCHSNSQCHIGEYKPILQEVEKMLSEAGLDEEEIRRSAAGGADAGSGKSRNRR